MHSFPQTRVERVSGIRAYFQGRILSPFGHGQSYTSFSYSALTLERLEIDANDSVTLHAQISNTGDLSGADMVQLYVSTPDAAPELERPIKLSTSSADVDLQQELRVRVTGALRAVPRVVSAKPQLEDDAAADIAQRVVFPRDSVVLPALTVAFSDDTLYGYITRGHEHGERRIWRCPSGDRVCHLCSLTQRCLVAELLLRSCSVRSFLVTERPRSGVACQLRQRIAENV